MAEPAMEVWVAWNKQGVALFATKELALAFVGRTALNQGYDLESKGFNVERMPVQEEKPNG